MKGPPHTLYLARQIRIWIKKTLHLPHVHNFFNVRYYFDGGWVRYDYVVGAVRIGEMRAYQGGREVLSCFERRGRVWGVKVVGHDRSQPLVIDPLVYSTYLGGSWEDVGRGIAVDGSGQAYVTGETESPDFDVTPGAYQTTFSGGTCGINPCSDVFVTKLSM